MFTGLIQATAPVLKVKTQNQLLQIYLKRPLFFRSLKEGESICVDGICLTLEKFDSKSMRFCLAPETLKITAWTPQKIKKKIFNLERSLTLKSLVGGHLVTGHGDGKAVVKKIIKKGKSCIVQISVPKKFKKFFWKKGYIALNGVSLTINRVQLQKLDICLVPETLKATNLVLIKKGDHLIFEVDYISRIFMEGFKKSNLKNYNFAK